MLCFCAYTLLLFWCKLGVRLVSKMWITFDTAPFEIMCTKCASVPVNAQGGVCKSTTFIGKALCNTLLFSGGADAIGVLIFFTHLVMICFCVKFHDSTCILFIYFLSSSLYPQDLVTLHTYFTLREHKNGNFWTCTF
ncbi:hypothetical protein NL108_003127 [Boleophthalmus pectinirostris]|nr:hypothetical protein NL108_003127 [Boleophthalmus pectinirostris]